VLGEVVEAGAVELVPERVATAPSEFVRAVALNSPCLERDC
jgi:hypothetical protein